MRSRRWLVREMLITFEPHGIFGSNFSYLFKHHPDTGMQNGDDALPGISLACKGLVKILITIELQHILSCQPKVTVIFCLRLLSKV